jgi:hypothetical protein
VGFRQRGGAPPRRPWPLSLIPDSGPGTALRVRCRCVWSCLVSPSASWPAGCHAATAGEDGADCCGLFDAGHDPYRAAKVAARAHVDVEDALEALRPSHRAARLVGAAVLAVGPSRRLVRRTALAAPRWRQLRAQLRVWRKRNPGHPLSTTNVETHIKSQQEDVGVHISRDPQHRADGFGLARSPPARCRAPSHGAARLQARLEADGTSGDAGRSEGMCQYKT